LYEEEEEGQRRDEGKNMKGECKMGNLRRTKLPNPGLISWRENKFPTPNFLAKREGRV
jgi:hypothetical protein